MEYYIYRGIKPNMDVEVMAISISALFEDDCNGAEDFFVPGTTTIEKVGEIKIEGGTYLLDEYFSVRG